MIGMGLILYSAWIRTVPDDRAAMGVFAYLLMWPLYAGEAEARAQQLSMHQNNPVRVF